MTTSRPPLTCDEVRDILAVQALEGHLAERDERVEAHCRECEGCKAARSDYEDITGLLAFGLPDAPASPAARERLRARIAASRAKRPRRLPWAAAVAAACALSLALGVVIGAVFWRGGDDDPRLEPAPSARVVLERASDDSNGNAWAEVLVNSQSRVATLLAYDLPALPPGSVYQFWFVLPGGERVSAGVLTPDEQGRAQQVATLPTDWPEISGMCITREPAPGSQEPQGPYVLVAWW